MCKKFVIALLAVAVGVAAVCLVNEKVRSWLWMKASQGNDSLSDMIDPDQEIARLRFEIKNLEAKEPEMRDKVAKEAVAVDNLGEKLEADSKTVKKLEAEVKELADALPEDGTSKKVSWKGAEWPRKDVETQLAADLKLLKAKKRELETEQGLLAQRKENLAKMKEQRASLKATCMELQTEVAQLESELKSVQMQEANNAVAEGDNGYSKIRADLKTLRDKIKERNIKVQMAAEEGEGPLHAPPAEKPTGLDLRKQAYQELGVNGDKAVAESK